MTRKKGFTLVELMVVVAIVAILAAVALPMFSTFKQKARVNAAIKSCGGAASALQNWFGENAVFSDLSVATDGGSLLYNSSVRLGAGLPEIENMDWTITMPSTSTVRINWSFSKGCPSVVCDGYYQVLCYQGIDKCDISIQLDANNTLGLNSP